ncbi:MAG: HEAT repeat domain-containing protein [Phycisphaerae bacterium]|nr:HEAT repeat domain-containing protein [Phycisphaerae bacterium]
MKAKTIKAVIMAGVVSAMVIPTVVKGRPGLGGILYPPPIDAFRRMRPRPPCWTAWWEANRDPYLKVIPQDTHSDDVQSADPYHKVTRQGIGQKPDPKTLEKYRKQAMEALQEALKSKSQRVRGSAALALGQIGAAESLDLLSELARKDKAVQVRQAAIIAIGLLDIPKGEEILSDIASRPLPKSRNGYSDKPSDRQSALMALGLMSRLSPATTVGLQKMGRRSLVMSPVMAWAMTRPLDPADPVAPKLCRSGSHKRGLAQASGIAASAISCGAMSGREDPANFKLFKYALARTNVPWIASEAILSLGREGNVKYAANLSAVLLATPRGKTLPAYKMLQIQDDRLMYLWKVRESKILCRAIREYNARYSEAMRWIIHKNNAHHSEKARRNIHKYNSRPAPPTRYRGAVPGARKVPPEKKALPAYSTAMHGYERAFHKAIAGSIKPRKIGGTYVERYLQLHYSGKNYDAVGHQDMQLCGRCKRCVIHDYTWLGLRIKDEDIMKQPDVKLTRPRKVRNIMYRLNLGVEPILQADLRASAAIALGRIDSRVSRSALRKVLAEKKDYDDEYDCSDIYKSMAIMSLGQLGDTRALPALIKLLRPTAPRGVLISKDRLRSPLRGFAALALGLYARPVKMPQSEGDVNRKGYDKVALLLAKRLVDVKEKQDFRAACALALGLTGRTENLKYLQSAARKVGKRDDILIGYVMLARGMLGDKTIFKPAEKFLAMSNNRTDRNGVLGRRAAVLGLGLTGSQDALPVLVNGWGLGYHVNRETALAMSLCQGFGATERLVKTMNESPKPKARALAARCLGELHSKVRPSRLARLSNGSNYRMRTPRLTFYQEMANEFLYTYLLAPSDNEWKTIGAD